MEAQGESDINPKIQLFKKFKFEGRNHFMQKRRKNLGIYLFVLPAVLFTTVLLLYPLIRSFWLSFTEYNYVYTTAPKFIGIQNFVNMFSDKLFMQALYNTFYFAIIFFFLLIITSLGIALIINTGLKGMTTLRVIVFLPVIVPMSLSGVMFKWILNSQNGILNYVLEHVGLGMLAFNWLGDSRFAIYSIIGVSVWKYTGIFAILYLAGLQAISSELFEAASIDGAGKWSTFIRITIPCLRESFIITGILGIIHSVKIFEQPYVMTNGGPGGSTNSLYLYAWKTGFKFFDMGYASAIGYVVGIIVLILSLCLTYLLNHNKYMN